MTSNFLACLCFFFVQLRYFGSLWEEKKRFRTTPQQLTKPLLNFTIHVFRPNIPDSSKNILLVKHFFQGCLPFITFAQQNF